MTTTENIRIIDTREELEAVEELWDSIAGPNGSICRLHGWNRAWWRSFESQDKTSRLHVIVVSDSLGRPGLIAPMMITAKSRRGIRLDVLSFAANGHSPAADLIYNTDAEGLGQLLESLVTHLNSYGNWDMVELQKMSSEDPIFERLSELVSGQNPRFGTQLNLESPFVPIEGDWDDFLNSKSSKFRKVMRNKLNRMKRAGNLTVDRVSLGQGIDHPPIEHILAEMTSVSRRSWKQELGRDLETDVAAHTFYRELLTHFGPRGMIDVWFFRRDDEPLAFEFHLKHSGVVYPIRADMDASIKDFSPGSLLEYSILKALFEQKDILEYNSCGSTYEYLLKWTDKTRSYMGLQLYGTSLRARALYLLEHKLLPMPRNIKNKKGRHDES